MLYVATHLFFRTTCVVHTVNFSICNLLSGYMFVGLVIIREANNYLLIKLAHLISQHIWSSITQGAHARCVSYTRQAPS